MGIQRGWAAAAVVAVALSACSKSEAKPAAKAAPATTATTAAGAVEAQSAPQSFSDPDDVNLPLDLKTLTQANDAATITYTAETYEAFKDDQADFAWSLDTDNDNKVDTVVGVEYEDGKLDAKVETPAEKELGPATVARLGPNGIKVTFSRRFAGSGASYQYRVTAISDLNHNDEEDARSEEHTSELQS